MTVFAAILAFSLCSCEKETKEPSNNNADIVGKWKEGATYTKYFKPNNGGAIEKIEEKQAEPPRIIEFNINGSATFSNEEGKATFILKKSLLVVTWASEDKVDDHYKIIKLTDQKLVWEDSGYPAKKDGVEGVYFFESNFDKIK